MTVRQLSIAATVLGVAAVIFFILHLWILGVGVSSSWPVERGR